jgi:HAD superfamily hydrolase (TIGR01509 family)
MCEPDRLLARRRLLIFDLDGTLADTSPIHARAFSTALAPLGITVDYPRIAGLATSLAMERLLAGAGQRTHSSQIAALVAAKRAAARTDLANVREVEGATAFIELAGRHHRLALCTSAGHPTAEATLAALGLAGRFDPMITADDVASAKPSPEGFLAVLERAQVAPADALVFEDSDAGLTAARVAGLDAIRVGEHGADWASLTVALAGVAA